MLIGCARSAWRRFHTLPWLLTEGIGLLMEKVWAEYLTLVLTVSFLPWELYELVRRPDWFRVSLLLINLAVLWYLIWLLRRKRLLGCGALVFAFYFAYQIDSSAGK